MTHRRISMPIKNEQVTVYEVWSRTKSGKRYRIIHVLGNDSDAFSCVDADTEEPCPANRFNPPCKHIRALRTLLGLPNVADEHQEE